MELWELTKKNIRKFLPAFIGAAWFSVVLAGLMGGSAVQLLFVGVFVFLVGFALSFLLAIFDQWKKPN